MSTAGTKVSCASSLSVQIPKGATSVTAGANQGTMAGNTTCAKQLGRGVEQASFQTDDAGDLTGKWQAWFNTGSVFGKFMLTPNDNSPPSSQSFGAASYTGTFTIVNGTGADSKAKGKGTMTCSTPDSVHYTCKQKGKLELPATSSRKA